ncbi:(2Fe-2S)-binding protein [Bradyrhizobium sp. STM 3809]|uniref:(2Fe-2S)-binding protein n=1 Tax=Bradyrhizobium sp. STM 3809 TaxID=551936 RepID=UPI000A05FC45|nr:(2Fe-2S)-binding protein [Bradyrhizobium sp. STM 3809]
MATLTVNNTKKTIAVDPAMPLLWAIRDHIGLTGTKYGCGVGLCGACTVLLDGDAVRSCSISVDEVGAKNVTTIEGLSSTVAKAVQSSWQALEVAQCGYCQSGQIVSAVALLTKNAKPTDDDISNAMDGNLCRCATYVRIRAAIHGAAKLLAGRP